MRPFAVAFPAQVAAVLPDTGGQGGARVPPTEVIPMARIDLQAVTQWITVAARQHGDRLPAVVMERLAISRRSALALLAKLVAAHWLLREGSKRKPVFRPGTLKQ